MDPSAFVRLALVQWLAMASVNPCCWAEVPDSPSCGPSAIFLNETRSRLIAFPRGAPTAAGANCTWWVFAQPGQKIRIDFSRFEPYRARPGVELAVGVPDADGSPGDVVRTYATVREAGRVVNASRAWVRLEADGETVLELNLTAVDPVSCAGSDNFRCRSEIECIDQSLVCDGYQDCTDKSDEFGCGSCPADKMRCSDPSRETCVSEELICDGRRTCLSYSDELDCGYCGPSLVRLDPGPSPRYVRSPPVSPGTDSVSCVWLLRASDPGRRLVVRVAEYVTESTNYVTAGDGHDPGSWASVIVGKRTGALPRGSVVAFRGDAAWLRFYVMATRGDSEANHFEFEVTQVDLAVNCTEDEFPCSYGLQCVPLAARCNASRECDDFSDELGCGPCSPSEFHCGDGQCARATRLCDAVTDCNNGWDEFDCYSICGPSSIHLAGDGSTPARLSVPAFYHYSCGWRVTGDPGAFLYADIAAADRSEVHSLSRQDDPSTRALPVDNYRNMAGSSLYASDGVMVVQAWSWAGSRRPTNWEFRFRAGSLPGVCGENQTRFADHNACLSARALCDGTATWADFADEMDCDTCGGFNIELSADHTVRLAFEFDPDTGSGAFAVHRGNSSAQPALSRSPYTTTALATATAGSAGRFDCLWRVTAPAGTRLEVAVTAYAHRSHSSRLRFDDGAARLPTAQPIEEIRWSYQVPVQIYFNGSSMWVSLSNEGDSSLEELEVEFAAHRRHECAIDHFQCPSNMACIGISHRCDGFSDCELHGDELGCGECASDRFECVPGGPCIQAKFVCDGLAECSAANDEFNCGDVESRINLTRVDVYSLDRRGMNDDTALDVSSPPGTRVVVTVAWPTSCRVTFGDGPYTRYIDPTSGFRTIGSPVDLEEASNNRTAYPHTLTSSGPRLWVMARGCVWVNNRGFWFEFRAFSETECSPDLVLCGSGRTCIEPSAVCDGSVDCPEFEDEVGCGDCRRDEFRCPLEDRCISLNSVCNGAVDCEGDSDELGCGPCGDPDFNLNDTSPVALASPAWPHHYPDSADCPYLLRAAPGRRVLVTFLTFDLEPGFDKLWVGNGLTPKQEVILQLSGQKFPATFVSIEDTMYLLFSSDHVVSHPGFTVRVEQVSPGEASCEEGQVLCDSRNIICVGEGNLDVCPDLKCDPESVTFLDEAVVVKSPGYPQPYPAGLRCSWDVPSRGPDPATLLRVLDFATEAGQDVLEVSGLSFPGGRPAVYALTGAATKTLAAVFNATEGLTVHFWTDLNIQSAGFHLHAINVDFTEWNSDLCLDDGQPGFTCEGLCLVAAAECDGFLDCPDGQDEDDCADVFCPSFYHCRQTMSCIQINQLCDGRIDCQYGDDEVECGDKRCPTNCSCTYVDGDFHVVCSRDWRPDDVTDIARITVALQLTGATNRSSVQLLPGLFKEFQRLRSLSIPYNTLHMIPPGTFYGLGNLTYLNISGNEMTEIVDDTFGELRNLEALIITDAPELRVVAKRAFGGLQNLKTLVLVRDGANDNPLDAEKGAFSPLPASIKAVVDDYRLCCSLLRDIRGFEIGNCLTTQSQPPLNLCGSLMQNHGLRVCMWLLGISALLGNLTVIVWQLRHWEPGGNPGKKTHSLLVLNLAVSDFLMGVYMLMIAAADVHYGERYSAQAGDWRSSAPCKAAGVLSVLSSEASVFFVTLISLDCLLCVVFPFSRCRLRGAPAMAVVAGGWLAALCLAAVPTLVVGPDSDVYGLSDVCIGLPLTTKADGVRLEPSDVDNPFGDADSLQIVSSAGRRPAWILSIVVFLGINLACFLVVLACYVAILVRVKLSARRIKRNSGREREVRMAVKMALIVGTDFACWMPVIVLGILSQTGAVHVGAAVYSWVVVLVLPINSSLNPYLYTVYSSVVARRHHAPPAVQRPSDKVLKPKTGSVETVNSHLSDTKRA